MHSDTLYMIYFQKYKYNKILVLKFYFTTISITIYNF